jgi:outer membrane protein OmpA-like peptidoglycan-associated protein
VASADQPWDLELSGGSHLFSGNGDKDQAHAVDDAPGLGLSLDWWVHKWIAPELEIKWIPTTSKDGRTKFNFIGYRLNGVIRFNHESSSFPFVLAGLGGFTGLSDNTAVVGNNTTFEIHVGIGYRLDLGGDWGLRVEGRAIITPDVGLTPLDAELWIGIAHMFGKSQPPPPVVDSDGDGIPDDQDACPHEAGPAERKGCPVHDRDKDGIADEDDKCPDEPAGDKPDPKMPGCPIRDKDGDGIVDSEDPCPDEAPGDHPDPKKPGCPIHDRDHDGIPDEVDKCPDEPETVNGYQDADGCPDTVPVAVAKFTGTIKGITFETGSAVIAKSSNAVLDEAAKVLKEYDTVKLEISGHTDDTGTHDANMKLSQDRADAVKKYLVDKGIADDRLKAVGYGPEKPVDPAKTATARSKNRRVEFQLIQQ